MAATRHRLSSPALATRTGPLLFADGFESGDTSAWSETIGGGGPPPLPADAAFAQSFTWNELGQIRDLTYPRCTAGPCAANPGTPHTVRHHHAAGLLTRLEDLAAGLDVATLTYHSNGLVATIAHENGVTVTQQNDPHFRPRPRRITTAGGNRNWDSGPYAYDGAGNVAEMGVAWFVYDLAGRIAEAELTDPAYLGGTVHRQAYQLDRYGNLPRIATYANDLLQETRSLAVFPSSNRLAAAVYDAAGNLTAWGDETYAYGPLGEMLTRSSLEGDQLYAYTADDERLLVHDLATGDERWTIRDLSGKVLTEYRAVDGAWTLERDALYRDGHLLASATPGQPLTHYHLDHLGTPRLLTGPPNPAAPVEPDPAGPVAEATYLVGRHNYLPFGEEATPPAQHTLRHRFTGHERDRVDTAATAKHKIFGLLQKSRTL